MTWAGAHGIVCGDVLATLRQLPSNEFDALMCDPPYGFGNHQPTAQELIAFLQGAELDTGGDFMGKDWHVPSVTTWREAYRVLKPGAPVAVYGGPRTHWLIALGLCAAGFEVRDEIMWLYGKGFPKSQNIALAIDKSAGATREVVGSRVLTGNAALTTTEKGGTYGVQVGSVPAKTIDVTAPATDLAKAWDGFGTALKPAWEPVILARKPLDGTMVHNVTTYGVGGLAIDACRIGNEIMSSSSRGMPKISENVSMGGGNYARQIVGEHEGRWPANLVLTHTPDCVETANGEGCVSDCPIYMLDHSVGTTKSVPYRANEATGAVLPMKKRAAGGYADAGGPSRFFYCAKVSTKEREFGCDVLPMKSAGDMTDREDGQAGLDNPRAGAGRTSGARNHHPTLKPLSLNRWLSALILPPAYNGRQRQLLVPYSGAGSEMIGALQSGWDIVFGIEGEPDYARIAEARIAAWGRAT